MPAIIQTLRSPATTVLLTTSTLTVLPSTATASAVIEGRLRTMLPVCQITPKNARFTNTKRIATATYWGSEKPPTTISNSLRNTPESGSPQSASAAAMNIGPVHGIARPASVTLSTSLVS